MGIFDNDIIERNHPLEGYQNLNWDEKPLECMQELYKFVSGGKSPCNYAVYEGVSAEVMEEGKHNIIETLRLYNTYIKPNLNNPKEFEFKLRNYLMRQECHLDQNGIMCMKYNRPQGAPLVWLGTFLDFSIANINK